MTHPKFQNMAKIALTLDKRLTTTKFTFRSRTLLHIVKALDEHRDSCFSVQSLFSEDVKQKRMQLVCLAEEILTEDFEAVGKKTQNFLWRKAYYDPISTAKKLWKQKSCQFEEEERTLLLSFMKDAISNYKTLILKFEDLFSLDLRFIIDFDLIESGANEFEKRTQKEIYTANELNHAVETIHAFLVCLGDLHRYGIEFSSESTLGEPYKELASKFYMEAFKLNPTIGMPHNQLGTLRSGNNYEIDSIFHYLYSLCLPKPFDLSETNINRIFQQNVEALEKIESSGEGFNERDFMMQMILLVDVFFYDKEIDEFNTLCRTVLISFKEYLTQNRGRSQKDLTFQLTSILILCLLNLRLKKSPTTHSLVAFLVAFCAEIVEVLVTKINNFTVKHAKQDQQFADIYDRYFNDFEKDAKTQKQRTSSEEVQIEEKPKQIEVQMFNESGSAESYERSKTTKKPRAIPQPNGHSRRRRKRCKDGEINSNSEESETESLPSDHDSDSMNSDFESYDENDDLSDRYSSDEQSDGNDSENDDIVIESEEIVFKEKAESRHSESKSSDDMNASHEHIEQPQSRRHKYKKKYTKFDPNLIIDFNETHVSWMKSLKLLFDWLRLNNDILVGCYRSNPEFINKIFKVLNFLNIDIFTRKIFFDRSLLTTKNVRDDLRQLFDIRHQIPTEEDVTFKKCALFDELQNTLDWQVTYKLKITTSEDVILRNFKIVDFGFYLCKMKRFSYNFCAKTRMFVERAGRQDKRRMKEGDGGKKTRRRVRNRERKRQGSQRKTNGNPVYEQSDVDEYPTIENSNNRSLRKGYLKSKTAEKTDKENETRNNSAERIKSVDKKNELMGKLWLKSEIQTLESKKMSSNNLTPYIMVDSKCLTNYLNVLKNLVKSKKFIVLIPKAGKWLHRSPFSSLARVFTNVFGFQFCQSWTT